ncbi:MAG: 7-cyano-7-deazaguanine synthase [Kofleriaceae bacterium]
MSGRTALLLSGGMDSTAIAFWKRPSIAVTIDYGQLPARGEIDASAAVCADLDIRHEVLRVDCSSIGAGDLAGRAPLQLSPVPEWWPFRNQLLVTLAAARLISEGIDTLMLGTVRSDGVHADGTIEFVSRMNALLMMQEGAIQLLAPAIELTSAELVRTSGIPFEILAWSHSCHRSNLACGYCRGCHKHFDTMKELGIGPY